MKMRKYPSSYRARKKSSVTVSLCVLPKKNTRAFLHILCKKDFRWISNQLLLMLFCRKKKFSRKCSFACKKTTKTRKHCCGPSLTFSSIFSVFLRCCAENTQSSQKNAATQEKDSRVRGLQASRKSAVPWKKESSLLGLLPSRKSTERRKKSRGFADC